jgi:hypothetical protein
VLCFCVTFRYQLVSTPPRTFPHAPFPPSWLKAYGYKLIAISLTPFFPTLARHVFNCCIVYHFRKTGGGGSGLTAPLHCASAFRGLCVSAVSLLFPLVVMLFTFPLSSFPTSLLPREPSRGVAKASRLSPFTATLTQKQRVRGIGHTSRPSGVPFHYFIASLLRSFFSLFQVQWEYPFPVITGENQ